MNSVSVLVGKKIREMRQKNGVSQEKLALLAEIDRSYMGRIERGEVNITLDKLFQICVVLECEAAILLPMRAEIVSRA